MSSARMVVLLLIIGVLSGGILAGVYEVANPLIQKNRQKELAKAIFEVLPRARSYQKVKKENVLFYQGLDENKKLVGIAFVAQGPGFQGAIKMMVGMDNSLRKLTGLRVLENVETPGLGGKITEEWFQDQFKGISVSPSVEYVKNQKPTKPNQIEAISGATISSRAIVDALNREIGNVKNLKPTGDKSRQP